MTIRLFATALEIAALYLLIHAYIRWIIQPILRWGVIRKMMLHRAELRRICGEEHIPLNAFQASYLDKLLRGTIARPESLTFSSYLHSVATRGPTTPSSQLHQFEQQASMKVRKIHAKAFHDVIRLMLYNSLGWFAFVYCAYQTSRFFSIALRPWFEKKSATFVEERTESTEADFCVISGQ